MAFKPFFNGFLATLALLTVFLLVVTLLSGWSTTRSQLRDFWYYILALASGFGIQVGLYTLVKARASKASLAVSGTTSTAAMLSCCTHYLVNLIPLLGATALVSLVSQYQVRLFWVGIGFNLFSIFYMVNRLKQRT